MEKRVLSKDSMIWLLVAFSCFVVSFFVMLNDVPNQGLTLLFLLPLSFSISVVLFSREYSYMKESFGLKIVYLASFVRYVITPLLIVFSQSVVKTILASEGDYFYAIIVEVIELYIVMIAIRIIWPRHLLKKYRIIQQYNYDPEHVDFELSWTGFAFVGLMIAMIILRGHWGNIISHLSTWFNQVINRDDIFGYDMMAFNIVKTVLFLLAIALIKRLYDTSSIKIIPLILAIIAGLLNTNFYDFTERTDLAVLIIASFFVLQYAFPRDKKFLRIIFGVGGVLLVAMVFLEGTLQYQVGTSIMSVDVADYERVAELYTTGPSVLANAHLNYESMRSNVTFMTYAKDLVHSCDLFGTLPFLRFIYNAVSGGLNSVEIYMNSIGGMSYIIPNHSLAALYVGDILCWILEPVFIILNIKLLGWFERSMFKINDLAQVYAVTSIITMVAMGIFCNNFVLMLHSFTSLPLWLLFFSYINNLGRRSIKLKLN